MYSQIEKLASAIRNNVVSGLKGYHTNLSFSIEQICADIVDERLQILKEYSLKGVLPLKDLYISINCISHDNHLDSNDIDCEIEFTLRNYLSYINKTDFSMQFRFVYVPGYTYATKLEGENNGRKGSKV